jgi:hypothetical protein
VLKGNNKNWPVCFVLKYTGIFAISRQDFHGFPQKNEVQRATHVRPFRPGFYSDLVGEGEWLVYGWFMVGLLVYGWLAVD